MRERQLPFFHVDFRARANGTTTSYSYDGVSRLSQLVQDPAGTAHDLVLGFGYNPAGQIVCGNSPFEEQTMFRLLRNLQRRLDWVRAMRLYRANKYQEFLRTLGTLESTANLTSYQLAVKANALLLLGKYEDSLALFSALAMCEPKAGNDTRYLQAYARAMLADINGNKELFQEIANNAASIDCSYVLRKNLPLK